MIKFLLYFFLFYFVFRYVFGGMFKTRVIHHHYNNPFQGQQEPQHKEEGKITIDPKIKTSKKDKGNQVGEYVDFEEVK